nr:hypothetical protein [Tanacetum cinerariifolium]
MQVPSIYEPSTILAQSNTKSTSVRNIISYSQYMNESQYNTVRNSTLPALQDDLIFSVIEQLKTQVVNYTKINQDNKKVNELLMAELERYRNQERILTTQMNDDNRSTSYAHSVEIDTLKHTLSEHLKEKETLEQKITLLKNDFQKEESRNIDRELALEKETESSAEEAFWSQYSVQTKKPNLSGTTIVEVPKELPKVSMELFTSFDQCLIDEVTEVQNIFKQMELAVEQHCAEKTKFQTKIENVLQEHDRILTQSLSVEIVNIVVHDNVKFNCLKVDAYVHCVTIESELKPDFIKKECYETLLQQYHILEKHCSGKGHSDFEIERETQFSQL